MASTLPLIYIHIPKTGGESLNHVITDKLTPSLVHAERFRPSGFIEVRQKDYKFISGHVRLAEAKADIIDKEYCLATVVRNPLPHFVSHLNWGLHISADVESRFFKNHPKEMQELSLYLRQWDFRKSSDVRDMLRNMPDIGLLSFHNCQCRYLALSQNKLRFSEEDFDAVVAGVEALDLIGRLEDLSGFMSKLNKLTGLNCPLDMPRMNSLNNRYALEISEDFEEIAEEFIGLDKRLYDWVKEKYV